MSDEHIYNGSPALWRVIFFLAMLISTETGYIVKGIVTPEPYAIERLAIQQSLLANTSAISAMQQELGGIKTQQDDNSGKIDAIMVALKLK